MSYAVELKAVTKTYRTPAGDVPVLNGVDATVPNQAFCAITGPSGSGKTTLLNLITLLDTPTSGEVILNGQPLRHLPEATRVHLRKTSIGMIFQKPCLLPHRSALDNVIFRARYLGGHPGAWRERAEQIMDRLDLSSIAQRKARLLSGGEMQRVAIARALLVPPALIAADEPTGNLDRTAADAVMNALEAARREGIAVILVTHNHGLLHHATIHYECREGRLWRVS